MRTPSHISPTTGTRNALASPPVLPTLYAFLSVVAFLLLAPALLLMPKLRGGFAPRMGVYPRGFLSEHTGPRVWLHGASAGDLLSILPIYRELRDRRPDAVFIISTMTNSGEAIARTRFADAHAFTFIPWDVPWAVRGAVRAIRPDVLSLEYTELWPNLIHAVKRAGGRVVVTNGRISERNVGRYRALFRLSGNLLRAVDLLLMREQSEAERALALGARPEHVRVTGNTKFDALLLSSGSNDTLELAQAFALEEGDRLWVAGSTHEGEEGILLDVFKRLRQTFPELRLVIAPRYLERVARVAVLAEERGLAVSLRSSPSGRPPVLILDTIGELLAAYRLATIVFVGGSFTQRGGQNILEPAACAKPVLFGPNMENFHDSVQILVGRGAIQVNDERHLETVARDLLGQEDKRAELGELARQAVSSVRGASARDADAIVALLPPPKGEA